MGLLDQVIGGMFGSDGTNRGNSGIADALKDLLSPGARNPNLPTSSEPQGQQGRGGGLDALLESFTRAGQGEVADSWVRDGQNQPVSPHQLEQAIDPETVDRLSRQTGLSREELLRQLAQHLPSAVDRLTPQGRRPGPEDMGHW